MNFGFQVPFPTFKQQKSTTEASLSSAKAKRLEKQFLKAASTKIEAEFCPMPLPTIIRETNKKLSSFPYRSANPSTHQMSHFSISPNFFSTPQPISIPCKPAIPLDQTGFVNLSLSTSSTWNFHDISRPFLSKFVCPWNWHFKQKFILAYMNIAGCICGHKLESSPYFY